jgi:glycosyltransferase involved in cell wall biosynthesis
MLGQTEQGTVEGAHRAPANEANIRPDVSVVLPCLNEAGAVAQCVHEAAESMARAGIDGEVVVVDNGSTDASAQIAESAGARVIREPRPGYGQAIRTGIEASRGTVIVMADADCSYDFQSLPALVAPVRKGEADLVLGSRLGSATRESMPALHRFIGTPVLNFLIRRAAGGGLAITDSQSGYRAFRRDVGLTLGLRSNGMEFASDMLIRYGRAGLRVAEVPTNYRERVGSSKLNAISDGVRHLKMISLLAPQLVLLAPGALAFFVGLLLTVMGFIDPSGVQVGSLHWQPIFFSTIAITLGLQVVLLGMVLANQSSWVGIQTQKTFHFVGTPAFSTVLVTAGCAALIMGFGLDAVLLVRWLGSGSVALFSRALAFASAAQSLILVGGSLLSYGFLVRWLRWGQQGRELRSDLPGDG